MTKERFFFLQFYYTFRERIQIRVFLRLLNNFCNIPLDVEISVNFITYSIRYVCLFRSTIKL